MTPTAWSLLAVLVPVVLLLIGAGLLAYGLVTWTAVLDRRSRDYGGRHLGRWS